jgi:hypothetical protein
VRKLIMWNLITLDVYFEGDKNRDLPFHEVVWGEELEKKSNTIKVSRQTIIQD